MKFLTSVDNLGRVVLPSVLLEQLRVKTGEQLKLYEKNNMIKIVKIEPTGKDPF